MQYEIRGGTTVTISFDPETINPIERQRAGWSAILENFKKECADALWMLKARALRGRRSTAIVLTGPNPEGESQMSNWKYPVIAIVIGVAIYASLAYVRDSLKQTFEQISTELGQSGAKQEAKDPETQKLETMMRSVYGRVDPSTVPEHWKHPDVGPKLLLRCGSYSDADAQALCVMHALQTIEAPK